MPSSPAPAVIPEFTLVPRTYLTIPAATVANTSIKTSPGRIFCIMVTAVGTNAMQFVDDTTGNVVYQLQASAPVGSYNCYGMPFGTSLIATGNAANPAVTVGFA